MIQEFKNQLELIRYFNSELKAMQYLEGLTFRDGVACPHCGSEHHYRTKTRFKHPELKEYKDFVCKACMKKYSTITGTIFESSNIPLTKWFLAIYVVTAHKKGIASTQLASDIGVTQKSAWHMLHRIREMLAVSDGEPIGGTVEIDETYVSGKDANRRPEKKLGSGTHNRPAVLGIAQRGGKVRAVVLPKNDNDTMVSVVVDNVAESAHIISDNHPAYRNLKERYQHTIIKKKDYKTEGDAHTNNIEGFWTWIKRSIYGIYHFASPKHLHRYCAENAARYNMRDLKDVDKFAIVLGNAVGIRVKYKNLIAK